MNSILAVREQAEEAQRAHDFKHAGELWRQLYKQNPINADYAVAAANAFYRTGDYEEAIDLYKQAKGYSIVRPAIISYNTACCYALLNQPDDAMAWFRMSIEEGFAALENAQEDDDLAILRERSDFRELIGLALPDDADHVTGWRYDLKLMVDSVKRISYKPFTHSSEEEFDARVETLYNNIPSMDDTAITLEMKRIIKLVGNGHTEIYPMGKTVKLNENAIPLELFWIDDVLIVLSASPQYAHLVTSQVTHIEGQAVSELRELVEPLQCQDNDVWQDQMSPLYLTSASFLHGMNIAENRDSLNLTFVDEDGKTHRERIKAKVREEHAMFFWYKEDRVYATDPAPEFLARRHKNYWLKHLPEHNLLYVQFNQVRNEAEGETLSEFAERVQSEVKENSISTIVVDTRWNSGGNNFLCMPLLNYLIGYDAMNMGRIFAIIGRKTFSAAQNFVSLLDRHSDTIFVGEPSGSAPNFIGETRVIPLPYSGMFMSVSDLFWQNSLPMDERPYIAPHIYTPLTLEDVRDGNDPAMDAILREIAN